MAEINKEDLFSEDALRAPKELASALGAVVDNINAIITASNKSEQVLKSSNSATKITKETEQLTIQEKELLKVQNQISIALAKNNDEYIEHKRGLDAINKALKDKINKGREDQTLTGKITKSMAELKAELKAARNELVSIAASSGTTSKEFSEAAEKAGALKDEINDINDAVKNTEAGKVENLGNALGDTGRKLIALDFGGAAQSARQFATASKSISFAEAGKSLKSFGSTLGVLGKALLTNPLFLLVAVIGAIAVAIVMLKDKIYPIKIAFDAVGQAIEWTIQQLKDFSDWLGISSFAADDKAEKVVAAAEKEIEALQKRYDREIVLAEAAGKSVEKLEREKWEGVINEATKGLQELFQKQKRNNDKLEDEDKARQDSLYEAVATANFELELLKTKSTKKEMDAKKKAAEEERELQKEAVEYTKKFLESISTAKEDAANKEKELRAKILQEVAGDVNARRDIETKFDDAVLQAKQAINKKIEQANRESLELQREQTIENLEKFKEIYQQFASAIGDLLSSVTARQLQDLELQKRANKDKLDKELLAAGDNEVAKEQIKKRAAEVDAKIAAEQLRLRQRQAKYDKATALFNAGLNIATAITKALPNPFQIALIATLGALQLAAILAKPIPAFAKGTKSSPAGAALVGELGKELLISPSGKIGLTPDRPSVMNLPKGTEVIPNKETLGILAMAGLQGYNTTMHDYSLTGEIRGLQKTVVDANDKVVNAILNSQSDFFQQGSLLYKVKKTHEGNRMLVRKKIIE